MSPFTLEMFSARQISHFSFPIQITRFQPTYLYARNIHQKNTFHRADNKDASKFFKDKHQQTVEEMNKINNYDEINTWRTLKFSLLKNQYSIAGANLKIIRHHTKDSKKTLPNMYKEILQIVNENSIKKDVDPNESRYVVNQIIEDLIDDRTTYSIELRDLALHAASLLKDSNPLLSLIKDSYKLSQNENGEVFYDRALTRDSYDSILHLIYCKANALTIGSPNPVSKEKMIKFLAGMNQWTLDAANQKMPRSLPLLKLDPIPKPVGMKLPNLPGHPIQMDSDFLHKYLRNWTTLENTTLALNIFKRSVPFTPKVGEQNILFRSLICKRLSYNNFKIIMKFLSNTNTVFKLMDMDYKNYLYIFRHCARHDR